MNDFLSALLLGLAFPLGTALGAVIALATLWAVGEVYHRVRKWRCRCIRCGGRVDLERKRRERANYCTVCGCNWGYGI